MGTGTQGRRTLLEVRTGTERRDRRESLRDATLHTGALALASKDGDNE